MIVRILILLLAALVACNGPWQSPSGPDAPPGHTEPPEPPEPPFNPGPQLDLRYAEIVSAFALNSRDEQIQRQFLRSARNRGYDTVRMCVELREWNVYPAFRDRGPYLYGQAALDAYENTLKVLADEGMSALVMTICSDLRLRGTNQERVEWVRAIARRTRGYENVAFEPNEVRHPTSVFRNDQAHIRELISVARSASGGLMSGADQNIGTRFSSQPHRYQYDNRWGSDFKSFHPWRYTSERDPDPPTRADVEEIVRQNGGWVVFSETIAYTEDPGLDAATGLYTSNREVINALMRACRPRYGCTWTFHMEEGLYADGPISWAPQEF